MIVSIVPEELQTENDFFADFTAVCFLPLPVFRAGPFIYSSLP